MSFATRTQEPVRTKHTVQDLLRLGTQRLFLASETPELDAEILLQHVINVPRSWLISHSTDPLAQNLAEAFLDLVRRRMQHEPIAYITGSKEFYGRSFLVDQRVLIPRPESELLIDLARSLSAKRSQPAIRIADVGTGSGCLAITLAKEIPYAFVSAVDTSRDALAVAETNGRRLDADDFVFWHHGHLLQPPRGPFDLVVANLPYVTPQGLTQTARDVQDYEPIDALVPGSEQASDYADGLSLYRELVQQLPEKLVPGGIALFEADAQQLPELQALTRRAFPGATLSIQKDLSGQERILICAT